MFDSEAGYKKINAIVITNQSAGEDAQSMGGYTVPTELKNEMGIPTVKIEFTCLKDVGIEPASFFTVFDALNSGPRNP